MASKPQTNFKNSKFEKLRLDLHQLLLTSETKNARDAQRDGIKPKEPAQQDVIDDLSTIVSSPPMELLPPRWGFDRRAIGSARRFHACLKRAIHEEGTEAKENIRESLKSFLSALDPDDPFVQSQADNTNSDAGPPLRPSEGIAMSATDPSTEKREGDDNNNDGEKEGKTEGEKHKGDDEEQSKDNGEICK